MRSVLPLATPIPGCSAPTAGHRDRGRCSRRRRCPGSSWRGSRRLRHAGGRIPLEREVLARHRAHGVDDLLPVADERGRLPVGGPGEPAAVELPTQADDRTAPARPPPCPGPTSGSTSCTPRPRTLLSRLRHWHQLRGRRWAASGRPRSCVARILPGRHVRRRRVHERRTRSPRPRNPWRTRGCSPTAATERADAARRLVADVDAQRTWTAGRPAPSPAAESDSRRRERPPQGKTGERAEAARLAGTAARAGTCARDPLCSP